MEPILGIICLAVLAIKIKDEEEREAQLKVVRVASHVNIRGRQAEARLNRIQFTRLHMDSSAKTRSSARKCEKLAPELRLDRNLRKLNY